MPYRKIPIVSGEIYHVFNRSIARQPIFLDQRDYQRAINLMHFYRYFRPPLRFSHYNRLPLEQRDSFLDNMQKESQTYISILAFCIMPNHFHFLIKELQAGGIATFMRNFQNSYNKYFNTKHDRTGSLTQAMFKAVRIETDEQLLHVNRYIHLNPYTGHILHQLTDLEHYSWSSFPIYLSKERISGIDKDFILKMFSSVKEFKQFTYNQADYQRQLHKIKHLTIE